MNLNGMTINRYLVIIVLIFIFESISVDTQLNAGTNSYLNDESASNILKHLSYSDNPIGNINQLIYNLTIYGESDNLDAHEHAFQLIKKLSKMYYMHDPNLLKLDRVYSSMLVVNSLVKADPIIYNTYKPLSEETTEIDNSSLLMDGDMRIRKGSELGEKIVKSLKMKNSSKRLKRKIKKKYYASGFSSRWPQKTIPYEFDYQLAQNTAQKKLILDAINHWQSQTCIKFEPYNPIKHDSIYKARLQFYQVASGCYSDIGYPDETLYSSITTSAVTSVFLSAGCVFGQIVHEIGHAVGFYHEQNRGDRDNYITIIWDNILDQASLGINFYNLGNEIEPNNFGVQYDLSSIMHYDSTAFGFNGKQTIKSNDANLDFLMGNRAGLSYYDIKIVCLGYNCSDNCVNPPLCLNDGFVNSNCTCTCPDGISGLNCEIATSKKITSTKFENLILNCTFQIDFCDWIQESYRDEVDFVRNKGLTLAQYYRGSTGPVADRFNNPNNSYIYLNSYYLKYPGESAMLITPEISVQSGSSFCLRFWYNMFANASAIIGNLSVYKKESNNDNLVLLWTKSGSQVQLKTEWLYTNIDISINSPSFRVIIKAQRHLGYLGDIAIDDIEFFSGRCSSTGSSSIWNDWSIWSSWSACSQTCGQGTTFRTRNCLSTDGCNGATVETNNCYLTDCAPAIIIPTWSDWGVWSSCSSTCGFSSRVRYRTCNTGQFTSNCDGGLASASQIDFCFVPTCDQTQTSTLTSTSTQLNVVDGGWSQWSAWDDCSKCSSQYFYITRVRYCNNPPPGPNGKYCVGLNYESQYCFDTPQCAVDGGWSDWSDWTSCSSSCGLGIRAKTRNCNNPIPQYSGKNCVGSNIEITLCNYGDCTPSDPIFIDLSTSTTTQMAQTTISSCKSCTEWSSWSTCNRNCGNDYLTQTRTRTCSAIEIVNSCNPIEKKSCTLPQCNNSPNCVANDSGACLPYKDGQWSNWEEWSSCTASCLKGIQTRRRYCNNPEPLNGGVYCVGNDFDVRECDMGPCDDCFSEWSMPSPCSTSCGLGWSVRSRQKRLPNCVGSTEIYDMCTINQQCISPQLTEWSAWSVCTQENCSGYKYRFRTCLNPSDFVNDDCLAKLVDKIECSTSLLCVNQIQNTSTTIMAATTVSTSTIRTTILTTILSNIWSEWSSWSTCCSDQTSRNRNRHCLSRSCVGTSIETESCDINCQSVETSQCSITCNSNPNALYSIGFQTRKKQCSNEVCTTGFQAICYVYTQCLQNNPIDGNWGSWNSWGSCSSSCGRGIRTRDRYCNNPIPSNGGKLCDGSSIDSQVCQSFCDSVKTGQWSTWSVWSECSVGCDVGVQTRQRTCLNGSNCPGASTDTISCSGNNCNSEFLCNFDNSNETSCQYYNLTDGSLGWSIYSSGSSTIKNLPSQDHTNGNGRYIYTPWDQPGDVSSFRSKSIQGLSTGQCLNFWRYMYGSPIDSFNIKLQIDNNETIIFNKKGNQDNRWLKGYAFIPENIRYKLVFESIKGNSNSSIQIAIDDISIGLASTCQDLICDFEKSDNCNFGDKNAEMKWDRTTSNYNAQVSSNLKLGSYYLTINANKYTSGQKAYFNLPQKNFEDGQNMCLGFSYILAGTYGLSKLNIYIIEDNLKQLLWSTLHVAAFNSIWDQQFIDISSTSNSQLNGTYQIIFEVVRGVSPTSNVNLDNIMLYKGLCSSLKLSNRILLKKDSSIVIKQKRQLTQTQNCNIRYYVNPGETTIISSPNYPNNYPINTECSYIINTQLNSRLNIRITDMDIEYTSFNLCPDSLEVRYNALGQMGIRLCGTISKTNSNNNVNITYLNFVSTNNAALMYFRSDWVTTRKGFQAQVTVV